MHPLLAENKGKETIFLSRLKNKPKKRIPHPIVF